MVACPVDRPPSILVSARPARSAGAVANIVPKRQGGDGRSQRIETYSQLILDAVVVKPDITLAELRDLLKRRGISAGIASLWRFFQRRKSHF